MSKSNSRKVLDFRTKKKEKEKAKEKEEEVEELLNDLL